MKDIGNHVRICKQMDVCKKVKNLMLEIPFVTKQNHKFSELCINNRTSEVLKEKMCSSDQYICRLVLCYRTPPLAFEASVIHVRSF